MEMTKSLLRGAKQKSTSRTKHEEVTRMSIDFLFYLEVERFTHLIMFVLAPMSTPERMIL